MKDETVVERLDLDAIEKLKERLSHRIFGFNPSAVDYQDSKRLWYAVEQLIAALRQAQQQAADLEASNKRRLTR